MSDQRAADIYAAFRERRSVRALAAKLVGEPGDWIETEQIVAALVLNAREPIPPAVLDYLCRRLDGTARKKRAGRAARSPRTNTFATS